MVIDEADPHAPTAPMARLPAIPPEPGGDRPAVWGTSGDVWQRHGPRGTATWFCTSPDRPDGQTWRAVVEIEREPTVAVRPVLPDVPDTGSFALPIYDAILREVCA